MEAGGVVGEGGEVGLGSAAADAVVGRGPGWGEKGSGGVLEVGMEDGEWERDTWWSRKGRRVRALWSLCMVREEDWRCRAVKLEFDVD